MSRSPQCAISTRAVLNKRLGEVEKNQRQASRALLPICGKLLEGQGHRRDLHCHAEPQPRAADHLGVPGGQARVCARSRSHNIFEAEADCGGRTQVRQDRAARRQRAIQRSAAIEAVKQCAKV